MSMKLEMLCVLCVAALCAPATDVTFFGGAGEVGGSCALIEGEKGKVLVDCGTVYGDESDASDAKEPDGFGFKPADVDALFVTHAHADHAGRVPQLVRSGFRGTIYMTEPTRRLSDIAWRSQVLYDDSYDRDWRWSVRDKQGTNRWYAVHWRSDCKWSQKVSAKNRKEYHGRYAGLKERVRKFTACRTCAELDVADVMKLVKTVKYDEELSASGFKVVFRPVEHLPGSAAIYFDDGKTTFAFSGDLGTSRSRLANPIRPSTKVDSVFVECTYGDKSKGDAKDAEREYARFSDVVSGAMEQGKMVWIPAFAMDRTQRLLLEVLRCRTRPSALYSLSTSGNAMTDLYAENPGWFPEGAVAPLKSPEPPVKRRFDPKKDSRKSAVLLTTSGMMDMGFSYGLLEDLVPDTNVVVCIVGYQAPGTPGRELRTRTNPIVLADGRKIQVGARAECFDCFSGHGDAFENDKWLGENMKSDIYLIHGDPDALKARREGLEKRHGAKATIVEKGRRYHLGKGK